MALMLMAGSTASIMAQATPDASPEASGAGGPALGDTIVVSDANGDPALQIAVSDFVSPDEDVDANDRGFYVVSLQLVVNNPTDSDIEFNSYSVMLIDGEGFTANQTFVTRDDSDYTARPDFSESTVPAGESISGWIFFQVINGAEPAWVVYSDSFTSQQFVVLANLNGTELEDGDAISFYNSDAEEAGTITVDEVIADFQEVDTSVDVERGTTVFAVNVTVENTGTSELPSMPTFYLVDDYGFQYYPTFAFRDAAASEYPDLPSDPPAPGESVSGVVLFNIADGAQVSYILAQPDYTQLYIVAQPGEGSVVSGDTLTPVPVSTEADQGTDDSSDTDATETADDGSTAEETGDCVGVADWIDQVNEAVNSFSDNEALSGSLSDTNPDDLRDAADQLRDAADGVDELDTPDVAQDTEAAFVGFINGYADIIDEAADRIDNGDDPSEVENDIASSDEFSTLFTDVSTAAGVLADACPDSNVESIFGS